MTLDGERTNEDYYDKKKPKSKPKTETSTAYRPSVNAISWTCSDAQPKHPALAQPHAHTRRPYLNGNGSNPECMRLCAEPDEPAR